MSEYPKNLGDGWEVTIAKTVEQVESLRQIWQDMQKSEPYPVINVDIDRYLSVNQARGDSKAKPYIVLVTEDGKPVAMLVGRIQKMPLKLKIGYKTLVKPKLKGISVVYGGVLGQPDEQISSLLIRELMKILRKRQIDVISFKNRFNILSADSSHSSFFVS